VFCRLVVLVRLSVPVQVIDWKDLSPKWPICVDVDVKPYSLAACLGCGNSCANGQRSCQQCIQHSYRQLLCQSLVLSWKEIQTN